MFIKKSKKLALLLLVIHGDVYRLEVETCLSHCDGWGGVVVVVVVCLLFVLVLLLLVLLGSNECRDGGGRNDGDVRDDG